MKTRCRVVYDPWYDNANPWRPQRRFFFYWRNFTSGSVYGGVLTLCFPTFDEAKAVIAEFRKQRAEVPL